MSSHPWILQSVMRSHLNKAGESERCFSCFVCSCDPRVALRRLLKCFVKEACSWKLMRMPRHALVCAFFPLQLGTVPFVLFPSSLFRKELPLADCLPQPPRQHVGDSSENGKFMFIFALDCNPGGGASPLANGLSFHLPSLILSHCSLVMKANDVAPPSCSVAPLP